MLRLPLSRTGSTLAAMTCLALQGQAARAEFPVQPISCPCNQGGGNLGGAPGSAYGAPGMSYGPAPSGYMASGGYDAGPMPYGPMPYGSAPYGSANNGAMPYGALPYGSNGNGPMPNGAPGLDPVTPGMPYGTLPPESDVANVPTGPAAAPTPAAAAPTWPAPPPGSLGTTYQRRSRPIPVDKHPRVAMIDVRVANAGAVYVRGTNAYRMEDRLDGFRDPLDPNLWHFESKPLYPGLPQIYRVEVKQNKEDREPIEVRYVRLIMGRLVEYTFE